MSEELPNLAAIIPNLVNVTGALYIASVSSTLLFGITIVQVYIYHIYFNKDNRYMKGLVAFIFLLDIFHTVISITQGWVYLAAGWGNPHQLPRMSWLVVCVPITDGLLAFAVQMFYAWRIWHTKRWLTVPVIIFITGIAQLVAVIYGSVRLAGFTLIDQIKEELAAPLTVWMAAGIVADICIVVTMSIILLSVGKGTTSPRPRSINRILLLTVETNAATTVVAISVLITFYASETSWVWFLVTSLVIGKLYANSLLVSLNSRLRTAVERTSQQTSGTTPNLRGMSFKQNTQVSSTAYGGRTEAESYQLDDASFIKTSDVQRDHKGAVVIDLHAQESTHHSVAV